MSLVRWLCPGRRGDWLKLMFLLLPIDAGVLEMLFVGLREDVFAAFAAGVAADEKEVVGLGGLEDGHNGGQARAGNRAGGQAGVAIGIIGGVDLLVLFQADRRLPPLPAAGLVAHSVLNG